MEHVPTMIWRTGTASGRDYFNPRWLAFTGRSLAQEVGTGWTDGVHPEDATRCLATWRHHFDQRRSFAMAYRIRRFDGVYRQVLDRGVPYAEPTLPFAGFVGSCEEVDDPRGGELSVGVEDFFEMSLDNLCVAGLDGYLKRVNPSWTKTLGWTAEELMAKPVITFVHPEDREATLAGRERLRAGSPMGPLVNRYLRKDGTYRWLEWRSVANGERGLVYAAARDITEQRQAEERLAEAQASQERMKRQLLFADRMASVGTLAAGVAHEINTPLTAVLSNIEMIVEELDARPAAQQVRALREMAIDVRAGAARIQKIVGRVRTFARSDPGRQGVVFDVQPVLELSIGLTHNELRHRARLVKDYGETPLVEADDALLGQVFVNLLVNAFQAFPEGQSPAHEVSVATSTDAAGRAVIEIRDTGAGIPSAIVDRVFDPFFTTKPVGVGTGLGLSICHSIVTGMGGEISLSSVEGRGTTVRLVLPAARLPVGEVAALPASTAGERGAVLVVDDEAMVGSALRRILRNHDVTTVTTAREALALLASGRTFDVILSDLMMPEMSGMAFYAEITRRMPELADRVVFVSGGAFLAGTHAFLDRVKNERIDKPFDSQHVRDTVSRFVARRRPS